MVVITYNISNSSDFVLQFATMVVKSMLIILLHRRLARIHNSQIYNTVELSFVLYRVWVIGGLYFILVLVIVFQVLGHITSSTTHGEYLLIDTFRLEWL